MRCIVGSKRVLYSFGSLCIVRLSRCLCRLDLNIDLGITYNQLNNNLTSQAATMTTNGLPNDVLSNLDPFALIILIPVCDLFVGPTMPVLPSI